MEWYYSRLSIPLFSHWSISLTLNLLQDFCRLLLFRWYYLWHTRAVLFSFLDFKVSGCRLAVRYSPPMISTIWCAVWVETLLSRWHTLKKNYFIFMCLIWVNWRRKTIFLEPMHLCSVKILNSIDFINHIDSKIFMAPQHCSLVRCVWWMSSGTPRRAGVRSAIASPTGTWGRCSHRYICDEKKHFRRW